MLVADYKRTPVKVKDGMGYEHEIAYFVNCIRKGARPRLVDPSDAAMSVRIVEAEVKSVGSGRPVKV